VIAATVGGVDGGTGGGDRVKHMTHVRPQGPGLNRPGLFAPLVVAHIPGDRDVVLAPRFHPAIGAMALTQALSAMWTSGKLFQP